MSFRIITVLSACAVIAACTTAQENPNYQYSTKYKGSSPYQTASMQTVSTQTVSTQAVNVQTQPAATVRYAEPASTTPVAYAERQAYPDCREAETTRSLIGAGVGGTVGTVAGDKLIGGTKGKVVGAIVGGSAGYAAGDWTKQCAEPTTHIEYDYGTATTPASTTTTTAPQGTVTYQAPTDSAYLEDSYGTPGYHAVMAAEQAAEAPATASTGIGYTQSPAATVPAQTPAPTYLTGEGDDWHEIVEDDTVYSLSRSRCVGVEDIRTLNNLDAAYSIKLGEYLRLPASRC